MAAKQRLDDQRLVPWIDEPTRSNASARGNIDRSPFATPAGQRSVSERVPNARLPPAQAVASSATWDRMRSWLTAQGQTLSSLGSSMTKHHHKEKDPGFIPATQPAHLPAIDLLADRNRSGQAKEFGLKFHGFTSMPLVRLNSQAATFQIGPQPSVPTIVRHLPYP